MQAKIGLHKFCLRQNIKIAAFGDQHIRACKQLNVSCTRARRTARAFGDRFDFAMKRSEERDKTIGFTQITTFENDGRCAIATRARHSSYFPL